MAAGADNSGENHAQHSHGHEHDADFPGKILDPAELGFLFGSQDRFRVDLLFMVGRFRMLFAVGRWLRDGPT